MNHEITKAGVHWLFLFLKVNDNAVAVISSDLICERGVILLGWATRPFLPIALKYSPSYLFFINNTHHGPQTNELFGYI